MLWNALRKLVLFLDEIINGTKVQDGSWVLSIKRYHQNVVIIMPKTAMPIFWALYALFCYPHTIATTDTFDVTLVLQDCKAHKAPPPSPSMLVYWLTSMLAYWLTPKLIWLTFSREVVGRRWSDIVWSSFLAFIF